VALVAALPVPHGDVVFHLVHRHQQVTPVRLERECASDKNGNCSF
jgi:hypothetical protein